MQRSEGSIRTTHAGRLPRVAPPNADLTTQVAEVIRKQVQVGISCFGDGEYWNDRSFAYYGKQFTGVTTRALHPGELATAR